MFARIFWSGWHLFHLWVVRISILEATQRFIVHVQANGTTQCLMMFEFDDCISKLAWKILEIPIGQVTRVSKCMLLASTYSTSASSSCEILGCPFCEDGYEIQHDIYGDWSMTLVVLWGKNMKEHFIWILAKVSIAQFISHHSQHWFKKKTTVMYPNVHPGWANPGLINSGYILELVISSATKMTTAPGGKRSSDPGQTVNDSSWKRHMRHSASTHGSKIIP